jgi:hypothetical protein
MPAQHIAKVVTKLKLSEQRSDFAYWQNQPPHARLAALEEICGEATPGKATS